MRQFLIVLGAATVLAVAAGPVCGAEVTVDCAVKHQLMHGVGGFGEHGGPDWAVNLYAADLQSQVMRIDIPTRLVPEEVIRASDIRYKSFALTHGEDRDYRRLKQLDTLCRQASGEFKIFASIWTPPHWMKENAGLSQDCIASLAGRLRHDRVEHLAVYLAEWVLMLKEVYGIELYAISPQNELVFAEPYFSCIYNNEEFRDIVVALGKALRARRLTTRIIGPEDMTDQPGRMMGYINAVMDDPATAPFLDIFASHGYSRGIISKGGKEDNASLAAAIKPFQRELWMTETGGGRNNWEPMDPVKYTPWGTTEVHILQRPGTLYELGAMMHNAFVYGHMSAWTLFGLQAGEAGSEACYTVAKRDSAEPGRPNKKFTILKHYSKHIRDGARRVEAGPDGRDELYVSAYEHADNGTLTVVLQNRTTNEARTVQVTIRGAAPLQRFEGFITDKDRSYAPLAITGGADRFSVIMPAQSMLTAVGYFSAKARPVRPATTPTTPAPATADENLILAIARGDLAGCRAALKNGAVVNPPWPRRNPFTLAIARQQDEIAVLLANSGNDLKDPRRLNDYAFRAARAGLPKLLSLLVERGVDANVRQGAFTLLMAAAESGNDAVVKLLVAKGADVNAVTTEDPWPQGKGWSALLSGAGSGNLELVRCLIEHGANLRQTTEKRRETALSRAIGNGYAGVAEYLIAQGGDVNQKTEKVDRPLLSWAVCGGRTACVQMLLQHGADVDAAEDDGRTALMWACALGHTAAFDLLIDKAKAVDAKDKKDNTALFFCARSGAVGLAERLLKKGAGKTNLNNMLTEAVRRRHPAMVKFLLAQGADPNTRFGNQSLLKLSKDEEITGLLVQAGARQEPAVRR